jgi:hypothetical protein
MTIWQQGDKPLDALSDVDQWRTYSRVIRQSHRSTQSCHLWINDPLTDNDAAPFGGFKMSGMGRELGEEGLDEFRETRHVHWDFEGGKKSWWYPYGKQ